MVADSNAIVREGMAPINRNAANWCDVRVGLLPRNWLHANFVDPVETLGVVLDLSHLKGMNGDYMRGVDVSGLETRDVVAATVECILTNAAVGHPPAKFVDLHVKGAGANMRYQRVFRLAALGRLPRRSLWGSASGPAVQPAHR